MGGRAVFPRVSGGIVLDSFSIVSLFTGLLAALPAGLVLLIGPSGSRSAGTGAAVSVVWGVTVLVFVSRFAQLGIAGDSEGGLFSATAGPWSGTLLAAGRLFVLWGLWVLPFVAWVFLKGEPQTPAGFPAPGLGLLAAPRIPFLLALWSGLGMVISFAFVAVSAAAPGFGDLFSPGLWRALFSGRIGELFVAIAGTFGPPVTAFAIVLPVIVAFVSVNPKAALTGMVLFLLYPIGMVLSLQGKLCGAYAAASLVEEEEGAETAFEAVAPSEVPARRETAPVSVHSLAPAEAETPGPSVADARHLHTLWLTRVSDGDLDGALDLAKEAIPAALAQKATRLAAEIYRRHLDRLPELGLDRTALDVLADQLLRDGDVAAAAWTFSQALDTEPTDPKAFKGLLRVAEHHLDKAKEPLEAIRVYRYLLERAPTSPFADHARDLLGGAERRAARPNAPQG